MTIYMPRDLARGLLGYCGHEDREISEVVSEEMRKFLERQGVSV